MSQEPPPQMPSAVAIWLLAARPKTLWASIAPVMVGSAMAFGDDAFHALSAFVALVCSVLIQVATNFANDLFDFEKGADTEARRGPLRVTQAGLVSPAIMRRGIVVVLLLVLLGGLYLIWRGGWPAVVIGVCSVGCGILYTGGPRPLGYMGLGDLFVLVFFGPVAVAGTYYVQTLTVNATVVVAGLAPGLLSVGILAVNNLRDADEDRRTGKRTLAVRFGPGFVRAEYVTAVVIACLLPLFLYLNSGRHLYSVATAAVVIVALPAFRRLFASEGSSLNPVLAYTARLLLLYSAVFSVGWMM